ncbi:hypothetical protein BC830DRAFT_806124 [Chytriomyces sp. MP71]|nr:hypothetical protein BC830DRAFT_806124 [Chytriomyces sp. MP71]
MERIVTLTELKKNPLHLSHLCDSSTIPHDISLLLARLLSPDPVKRPSALDILHDQCFDSLVPVMIHSPMSGSPSYSAAMNFRRPSMNFTIRASSSYSDFHHHQQIRQRRSASVIQSSVRFSSSPTDMPHFRSMPRSYHASAAFRRSVGAKMGSSSSSLEDRTREYPESTGSGELTPPAMASHPDRSSSLVEAPLEQSGSLAKQAAVPPVNAFSQLWGMIKNVTRPKDMSTASSQALDGTQDEQAAPNRHSAVPAASQYPKNIKHSSSNRSLASTNSTATSLSAKTLERHYADVSAVTPTFKPLPPGLDRRKSFHVIPIASATKRATSAAPISQPPANGSAGSTVFGMSPAESLHSYPRGVHRRASADGALRRSELGVSGVAGVGEDEEHQRILELENDVSVLLEQLVSMKERQMVMEAELAARGMQVVSEDEGEGEV